MLLAAIRGFLRSGAAAAGVLLGRPSRRRAPDRVLLEQRILPWYADRPDIRRVLFVGCARFTRDYEALFERQEYWTIDAAPRRRRWGAQRHIVARLERLGAHAPDGHFDLIVCNGVLGWGLDRREDAEAAFSACHRALRPLGELVLGWNDVAPRNRVRPDSLHSLKRFERIAPGMFDAGQIRVDAPHRHVFDFYRRPAAQP